MTEFQTPEPTPDPVPTPPAEPLNVERVPAQQTQQSNKGLFALIFIGLFAVLTVGALRFNQSFGTLNDLNDSPPALADDPATLQNSPLDNLEGPVFTSPDEQVIEFDLPEGGIVIPPGESATFELGPNGTGEDAVILIEIDEEGATITDEDGNTTRQDGQGNVIPIETETEVETEIEVPTEEPLEEDPPKTEAPPKS